MKQPLILSAHDTLLKLLGDRSKYVVQWLEHTKADPDKHTIMQFPVPGKKFSTHYFLVPKASVPKIVAAFGNADMAGVDELLKCPNIIINQSVAVADPLHHYGTFKAVRH